MKKLYVNSVSILFAVLCLVCTACNQGMTAGKGTGTVRITIGGDYARAVDSASGLPVFDKDNTTITVTKADGTKVVDGEKETEKTLQLPVDTKITVEVKVTTAAGEWSGAARHTVTEGANPITVTLSKAPKSMRNILIDVNADGNTVTLKQASGGPLLENVPIEHSAHHDVHPVIARDSIGRIYVLYRNKHSVTQITHLRRIDVEGNGGTDTGFHYKIVDALPPSIIDTITNMAIDVRHNYIFLFDGMTVYCLKEKEDQSFEYIVQGSFPIPVSSPNVSAAAVYDDVLFVVNGTTLYACKFKIEELPAHPGLKQLQFKPVGGPDAASLNLPKLRTDSAFGSNRTTCTGLFADEKGVYCLLSENNVAGNKWYMVGAIVQCVYKDDGTLEQKGEPKGLNQKANGTDTVITFDAQYFSNPVGFIGSDEDNLYIADDGVDFKDKNENWHITANKNRIAAFNRKTHDLTFKDAGATWYGEGQPYTSPNTPVLLWKNDGGNITYWTSADGTESFNATNKLFEYSSSPTIQKPTDAFCYDQDGNLYILWTDGSGYAVRRFELKDGTSYVPPGEYSPTLGTPSSPSYIAVDISGGQNYLYCGYKDITNNWKVGQMEWVGNFSTLSTPIRTITVGSTSDEELTALAANKDGVFAAVKETYQYGPISKYRLKVKKYKKSDGTPNGELTLVDGAAVYTDMSDAPIELGSLSSGDDYKEPSEVIDDLQVADNVLYGISSKLYCVSKKGAGLETFKNSGILYKIGNTDEALSASSLITKEKPADDTNKIGYGFYRFIAVKPKKLVIASDGGWGKDGLTTPPSVLNNKDTVFECDLSSMMLGEGKQSGGSFSHTLVVGGSGFEWANP